MAGLAVSASRRCFPTIFDNSVAPIRAKSGGCVSASGRDTTLACGGASRRIEFFESRAVRRPADSLRLFPDRTPAARPGSGDRPRGGCPRGTRTILKGLILAQNERWRRGLGMQVERIPGGLLPGGSGERGSKAWVTPPGDRESPPNGGVIPGEVTEGHPPVTRGVSPRDGPTWY